MTCTAETFPGVTAYDRCVFERRIAGRRAPAAAVYRRSACRGVGIGLGTVTAAGMMAGTAAVAAAWLVATALGGAPHLSAHLPLRAGTMLANIPPSFTQSAEHAAEFADRFSLSPSPEAEQDKGPKLDVARLDATRLDAARLDAARLDATGLKPSFRRVPFPRDRFAAVHADEGAREEAMLESAAPGGDSNGSPQAGATPPSGYVAATFDLFDPQPTLAAALPATARDVPQPPARVAARQAGSTPAAPPLQLADADATAALPPVAKASPPPPSGLTGFLHKLFGRQLASANPDVAPTVDGHTAIYDIEARTVFMPNGERLEAHSGLGAMMDDPRYVSRKDRGPTPPNVYDLVLRDGSFHGVQAIRLKPVNDDRMFGRDGILAHPYMLGASGQSFGCVSFKDYPEFLKAFESGEVDRLVVLPRRGDYPRYAAND